MFMDYYLLEAIVKNYGQAIRVVIRANGVPLITISLDEIREVFCLEPLFDYHIPINFQDLENEYKAKKDLIRGRVLKAHIGIIGTLPVITTASKEPFKKDLFTSWAIEVPYVEFLVKMRKMLCL